MWLAQASGSGSPDWGPILTGVAAILVALKGYPILRWLVKLRRTNHSGNGAYRRLEAENARLAKRNEYLEQRLWRAQEVEAENEALRKGRRSRSRSSGSAGGSVS